MWERCGNDAEPALGAPICMNHAKRLAVQVMLLTSNTVRPISKTLTNGEPKPLLVVPENPKVRKGLVYFLQFGERVKIGFTTNLPNRLKNVPHDKLLALVPGTISTERMYHKKFESLRITGEWFEPDAEMLNYIDKLPKHELIAA
jgi:hypothetical protein